MNNKQFLFYKINDNSFKFVCRAEIDMMGIPLQTYLSPITIFLSYHSDNAKKIFEGEKEIINKNFEDFVIKLKQKYENEKNDYYFYDEKKKKWFSIQSELCINLNTGKQELLKVELFNYIISNKNSFNVEKITEVINFNEKIKLNKKLKTKLDKIEDIKTGVKKI